MALTGIISITSNQQIVVSNNGGILQGSRPITLRNQLVEIRTLDNIPDVNVNDKVDGAGIIYNGNTGAYDVRPITFNDITGVLDEGEF